LDPDAAVRALTLSAAEILGVDDKLGSLEVGKIANVVVPPDHLCQVTSAFKHVFVGGRPTALDNQHTRFAEMFAERPNPNLPAERSNLNGPASQTRNGSDVAGGK
jgi:cytosine/adenosine deaminase-related metal-dependent hydrolase